MNEVKAEGRKDDKGKLRFDLIPVEPLEQLANVYTFGATKYADHNWRKGIVFSRIFGAIMRHMWAFWRGEDNDKESGLSHLAHACWGTMTLMEFMRNRKDLDDRYSTIKTNEGIGKNVERSCAAQQANISNHPYGVVYLPRM